MPIFSPKSFSKSALEEKQQLFQAQDLQTLEKCALALELVGRLRKEGLDFIFKGGTSLMLLFKLPKRLSIDVDILCLEPLEKLNEVLNRVVTEPPFNRWKHQDHRDREAPPTKHFQVYYDPIVPQAHPPSIQIDVIECESPYAQLVEQRVQAPFLEIEEDVSVPMPSASCLLGDKLAAFAPSTIGYPYRPISRTGREGEGITIYLDTHSTLLRRAPTWRLDIQREATEADLGENHYLEEVGETLWTTSLEIRHCPYCGQQLADPGEEVPADFGRFVHIDASGWHARRL